MTRLDDPDSGIRTEAELLAQLFLEELEEYGRTVSHSGRSWTTHRGIRGDRSTNYRPIPIWPISEYLARAKHRPTVAERIARLNPDGMAEGGLVRGWHPKGRAIDTCGPKRFNAYWGKGAHRRLRRDRFYRYGKRVAIPGETLMEGPPVSLKGWLVVT